MKIETAAVRYPPLISAFWRELITQTGSPAAKQALPDEAECAESDFDGDGMSETLQSPFPHLIHRYERHALLLVTARCAMRCRFCFRKRFWRENTPDLGFQEFAAICDYLREHPQVREILLSGGDPLMIDASILDAFLTGLRKIPTLKVLRLGTRRPVTDPYGVTAEHLQTLRKHNVRIMLHVNHPLEITPPFLHLIREMRGLQCFAQTVLLKGINDNPDILEELFNRLSENGIVPHYLFHIDPVAGVSHFATGLRKAHALLKSIRPRLSSLSTPVLAIDLPCGKGKILISPDIPLPENLVFESPLTGEKVRYPYGD